MNYNYDKRKRFKRGRLFTIGLIVLVITCVGFLGTSWFLRQHYQSELTPVSNQTKIIYFTVESGTTANQIAIKLEDAGLIRSAKAFEWYVRSQEVRDELKAGTYSLNAAMSTQEIVQKMVAGDVARNLLTILPGKRLDQLKETFKSAGYTDAQINEALNPAQYRGHAALVSLPPGASLEGYLYPDSYDKTSDTPLSTIITASLDEMAKNLTPDLQAGFAKQSLSTHQAITLASIIVQETSAVDDQPTVSQVFLRRLNIGMQLGSDVTAFYASAVSGKSPSVFIDSPYNTRIVKGLPPGPIGTVTNTALAAVANPATTDYLYFVAGDDGTTYFSHTQAEHEALAKKYCTKLCSQ